MLVKVNNPILKGFNPDPSIVFVDGYYYIATSTFEYYGGVSIHRSKDLINWELIGRALNDPRLLDLTGVVKSGGIWAPCLSYDKGIFYLVYTVVHNWNQGPVKDCYNYLVTASNVLGPYSDPIYLNGSGFDPSLFHDEDGKKYIVNMEWDFRQEGTKKFSGILLQEYDHINKCLTGEVHKIFLGSEKGLVEGPHIYKKDGFYYLITAEGGTSYEHATTVARSKSINGPYELHPLTHLVTSHNKNVYLQKAGHASLCVNSKGEWYLAHLCGRPVRDSKCCILGRETALQEIVWKDGWPYLSDFTNDPKDFIMVKGCIREERKLKHFTFDNENFRREFQTLRIPYRDDIFTINERPGYLTIKGKESIFSRHHQALIALRQEDFAFSVKTLVNYTPSSFMHLAGLIYRYDEDNQHYLYLTYDEEKDAKIIMILHVVNGKYQFENPNLIIEKEEMYLNIRVNHDKAQFYYSVDGIYFHACSEEFSTLHLSDEGVGLGFTGAFVGMCANDFKNHSKAAHFKFFTYERN